MLHQKNAIIAL